MLLLVAVCSHSRDVSWCLLADKILNTQPPSCKLHLPPIQNPANHQRQVHVDGVLYATGTHADEGQMGIGGANVAVFNFRYIDLAANITVSARGDRPLVILSRTSIVWQCELHVVPGTLGGWYGWGQTAGAAGTGVNERGGEGAGARAVYAHTLTVSGTDVDEIQTWTTTVE